MNIKKIKLLNFRNYKNIVLELSNSVNFIIGKNGSGKTNILEAISVVANLKSFRSIGDNNLIKWDSESYFCEVTVNNELYNNFSIGCLKKDGKIKKKAKIDNNKINRVSDYYGKLLIVVYSPEDINIINGNPEIRRKYFDAIISKVNNNYLKILTEFKKILSSRNVLLKNLKKRKKNNFSELDTWDELFAKKSEYLIKEREKFIYEFKDIFRKEYSKISPDDYAPHIEYKSKLLNMSGDDIYKELLNSREHNVILGTTSFGPQRDNFYISGENSNFFINYASQGQKRTAAIALKNCEKIYVEKLSQEKAIILVDDVFADLDEFRRLNLLDLFKNKNQVIFTMVNRELLDFSELENPKFFEIKENGKIEISEI